MSLVHLVSISAAPHQKLVRSLLWPSQSVSCNKETSSLLNSKDQSSGQMQPDFIWAFKSKASETEKDKDLARFNTEIKSCFPSWKFHPCLSMSNLKRERTVQRLLVKSLLLYWGCSAVSLAERTSGKHLRESLDHRGGKTSALSCFCT